MCAFKRYAVLKLYIRITGTESGRECGHVIEKEDSTFYFVHIVVALQKCGKIVNIKSIRHRFQAISFV